jgi:hypothetical protein
VGGGGGVTVGDGSYEVVRNETRCPYNPGRWAVYVTRREALCYTHGSKGMPRLATLARPLYDSIVVKETLARLPDLGALNQ